MREQPGETNLSPSLPGPSFPPVHACPPPTTTTTTTRYSRYLSFHFPFTHERSLLEHLRAVPWRFDQRLFKARPRARSSVPARLPCSVAWLLACLFPAWTPYMPWCWRPIGT